ncbi:putative Kinase family protein with leucine-rich repeat domain [Heracleum sosnowskyi]|uniref:Kinase family protein with leucine-rich repeat domain n=1 Tax=Heracleum sosnowskyi TaxID=360622 RepID=A0AAD8H581_9APIA|nr:putative Kinase family protein with leucine-rich repeat domain [Heracleum sosnowskyi]
MPTESIIYLHNFEMESMHSQQTKMDAKEDNLQFLGFNGIYKEAYKIIISWKKIFTQITLVLFLPLSLLLLVHIVFTYMYFERLVGYNYWLYDTEYNKVGREYYNKSLDLASSELIACWLFHIAYRTFALTFSCPSTFVVVFIISCVYTGREDDVTFRRVRTIVPKVWKRLKVTFWWALLTFLSYYGFVALGLLGWGYFVGLANYASKIVVIVLLISFEAGLMYFMSVWQMASVVSILEDTHGIQAMKRSMEVTRGKRWMTVLILLKLNLFIFFIQVVFEIYVVDGQFLGMLPRVGLGILCLGLVLYLNILTLVIQTIIYFVCKSCRYHENTAAKTTLSDQLDGYLTGLLKDNKHVELAAV